jgi:hypothetical protein
MLAGKDWKDFQSCFNPYSCRPFATFENWISCLLYNVQLFYEIIIAAFLCNWCDIYAKKCVQMLNNKMWQVYRSHCPSLSTRFCHTFVAKLTGCSDSEQSTNTPFIYQMIHCQYHLKTQCFRLSQNRTLPWGLIIWTLLSQRLVVATTTKPNLGYLTPASEVAGRHTLPF